MEEHRLALKAGYQIEHFRIESVLGKGGFGITYVAMDLKLGKRVAIKELLPDSIATRVDGSTVIPHSASLQESWEWARERFLDEARVLAGFSHPAIVGVHHLIEANGTVYMVMDFVDGESYEARLRRIDREPDEASLMSVIGPILDGLREVHAKGLLHRDIKPENILINRRGQPVLIDFGSARLSVGATMTMTSIVTHGYSPAEQYQTKGKMGPWTDIYALGAVMCRAITGEKPPVASDRIMEDDFEWLTSRPVGGFSTSFLQALDWALRVRPEHRPKSISAWDVVQFTTPPKESVSRLKVLSPGKEVTKGSNSESSPQPIGFIKSSCSVLVASVDGFGITQRLVETKSVARKMGEPPAGDHSRSIWSWFIIPGTILVILILLSVTCDKTHSPNTHSPESVPAENATAPDSSEPVTDSSTKATKENPFKNSLGMKFVPVPGTDVLFSIWDTRVKDYAAFAAENVNAGTEWKDPGFQQTSNHPVVNVSWDEAKAFCKWLTMKERGDGKIGKEQEYRLPTDEEWSVAVGAGKYPWGDEWPPSIGAGNFDPSLGLDAYLNTSPCGNLTANRLGLYDIGGNVWQWCEDWYHASINEGSLLERIPALKNDGGGHKYRVVRGGSWLSFDPGRLLSSCRFSYTPDKRDSSIGFRCVLASNVPVPSSVSEKLINEDLAQLVKRAMIYRQEILLNHAADLRASTTKRRPSKTLSKESQEIRVPFNFQWGESAERLTEGLKTVEAEIVEQKKIGQRNVLVVDGIPQKLLQRALFYFASNKLDEIELHYGDSAWDSAQYAQFFDQTRRNIETKYSMGRVIARQKNRDGETLYTLIGYEWDQPTATLQMFLFTAEQGNQSYRILSLHYIASK